MTSERIAAMTEKIVAESTQDQPLVNVEQAIDAIVDGLITLDENLPNVESENIPQKAALDTVKELLNEAIKPYFADIVKAMQVFE